MKRKKRRAFSPLLSSLAMLLRWSTRTSICGTGGVPQRGCIGLRPILQSNIIVPQIDDVQCYIWSRHPLKIWYCILHNSVAWGGYRQPNTQLQNRTPKWAGQNPESISRGAILSLNARKDFLKIPSLWEAPMETELGFFSKIILESNGSPNS